GQLTSADDGAAFDGIVFTGGPNLKRALAWAVPGDDDFAGFANGDFSFSGRMMVGADVLALSDATAQFNGSSMRGDLRWAGGPVPKLNVSLRGPVVDTRWFGLTSLKLADLHKAAQALAPGGGTSADGSEASQTSASIDVALDIGELTNGTERLSDVSVKIAHATDRLDIEKLKLSAAGGLDLDVRGELGQADSGAQGELQINIDVPTKTAGETLHQIISRQDLIRATDAIGLSKTLSDLGPTRLAMTAKLGQTKQQSVEVVFNGETAGRRIAGQARLDGGLAAWDSAPIDLYATLDTNDIVSTTGAIAARLGPVGAATDIATTSPRNAQRFSDNSSPASLEGRIVFKATGTPNERLSWLGDVQSKAINLRWSAVGVAGQDTALQLRSGEIDIVEARVGDLIKLADVQIGRAVHDEKVSGKITTATTDGKLVLASQNLNIAGETLSGTAEVTYPTVTEGTTRAPLIVSAKLRTKKLRAAKVLSGLLGQNALTAPAPRVAFAPIGEAAALTSLLDLQGDAIPLFSNQPFDLSLMTGLSGKLTLRVDELTVSDGLIWRDAKLQLTSTDEKSLALQVLLATTPTGPLTASLDLTRSGAGAAIKGRIQLNDGKLAGLFAPPSPAAAPADGRFDFEANFTGRGLSPRALLAATVGKGEVKLRGLSLNGLAPSKLGADAERLLQTPPDQAIDQSISPTVVGALTGAQVPIGNTAVPFVIRDGNVRFADMAIRADGGRLRGETTINLAQLTVDSAWRVNAENQEVAPDPPVPTPSLAAAPSATIGAPVRSAPAAWPPVRVVFVGPLASLAEVAPQYDTGAFERELAVRRIERVARRLEELRAEDEARAKAAKEREEELERQRQEEEARRKQAAAEERRLRLLRARERTSRSQRTPGGIQLIDPPAAIGFPYE
ncbi:MAG: AsmA-like C-terminal region-containing protein, partial [Pseudomonadota bacterium]